MTRAYREALLGPDGKDPKLGGNAKYMLDDELDLVILKPPADKDAMSKFLRNHWIFNTQTDTSETSSSARYFHERSLTWLVNALSTTIAAVLLLGSILPLHFIKNPDVSLALVIVFIVLFAIGLSISTSASRDSVFAATAAYAAVLVVFVSGNLGTGT